MADRKNKRKGNITVKYVSCEVTFAEVPDKVSLCIGLSGCPFRCKGCHSSFMQEDNGILLTNKELHSLISNAKGIDCVCFMGGDQNSNEMIELFKYIRSKFPHLEICWYSGSSVLIEAASRFLDYYKIGQYVEECGPLNNPNTNQRFYHITENGKLEDWTYKFWKKNENKSKSN